MIMKRKIFITALVFMTLIPACSGDKGTASRTAGNTQTVNDILEQGLADAGKQSVTISTPDPTSTPTPIPTPTVTDTEEEKEEEEVVLSTTEGIDVDLTQLSSTLVYSEVYNMMYMPEDYIGKVIKMEGACSYYHDDITGNEYYSCIIQDATACCAQGIEFVPVNPEVVPGEGGDVTVVGVFDTYMEGDYMYCTLRNATVL